MKKEYCNKAIEKAEYRKLEDGTWFAEIPGFKGVWANGKSVEECRKELIDVLDYNMNDFIVVDPKICSGKPVIKGTRIMVKNILGMVAGGYTMDRILEAYPELTRKMVQAALEYAAAVIDEEQVIARA